MGEMGNMDAVSNRSMRSLGQLPLKRLSVCGAEYT